MEGKEYPTRSKSGVRKTRTPWDNSSSLLFDEMVGVKRSPKTPPTGGKGTPSPKTSGKKTTSPSATKTTSKEKKVKSSPSKTKSGGEGGIKKASPITSHTPSPLSKVLYDYTHSPSPKITAVSLSTGGAGGGEVGGVLPRKFGGLFKPKAKLSKTAHQKLRESLKIFDFSSDSGSEGEEEGVAVKKPTKPKAPPSIEMNAESVKVKGENGTGKVKGGSSTVKQQGNTNYRRAPVKRVIAKKVVPKKTTPTSSPAPKKPTGADKTKTSQLSEAGGGGGGGEGGEEGEGGAGGKRKREKEEEEGEKGEGREVKKLKKKEEPPVDLTHYQNYPRLTRAAYRDIGKLGGASDTPVSTASGDVTAQQSAPQPSEKAPSHTTPLTTSLESLLTTSQDTPLTTSQDTPLTTSQDTPLTSSQDTPLTSSQDTPLTTSQDTLSTASPDTDPHHLTPSQTTLPPSTTPQNGDTECDDHMTSGDSHMTSSEAVFDVVEEPVNSVVHTDTAQSRLISPTAAADTEEPAEEEEEEEEEEEMETEDSQSITVSCGEEDPVIRSFTPPPNSIPSDAYSHSTEQSVSQSQSGTRTESETVTADEATPPPSERGGEGEKREGKGEGEEKREGKGDGEGEGEGPHKQDSAQQTEVMEEAPDMSLTEAADQAAFSDFDRHLSVPTVRKTLSSAVATLSPTKSYSGATLIPSLSRSSTWPRTSPTTRPTPPDKESQLCTVVRNVRQAHECLESGENQQFFDEMEYLMDSLQPSQPLAVRCLGTCNLATQCLRSEFSQQIRAHEFIPKITSALKDLLQHPTLSLTSSVLFYVLTRDKFNSDWDKTGLELLCGLLKESTAGLEQKLGGGKATREWDRMLSKTKSILQRLSEGGSGEGVKEGEEGGGEEGGEGGEQEVPVVGKPERKPSVELYVDVEKLEVSDLARECLLSLTAPVNCPHWIREELRVSGGLDILANMAIDYHSVLEGGGEGGSEGGEEEEGERGEEGLRTRLNSLERVLKCLENVTLMNKDNQSYLVIFDGSLLVSRLLRMLSLCQDIVVAGSDSAAVPVLLAILRVLLNLTHDNELGSHRLGEQEGAVKTVLDIVFLLCDELPDEHRFDTLVLGLGLLINMIEHNASNRQQLERLPVEYRILTTPTAPQGAEHTPSQQEGATTEVKGDESSQDDGCGLLKGRNTCIRSLISLFLKHYQNAEGATIEVPTPQRLSQISSSPHSSPARPAVRRDLTPSFADRLRAQNTQREKRSKEKKSPKKKKRERTEGERGTAGGTEGEESIPDSQDSQKTEVLEEEEEEEEEEEPESPGIDPLVFSRDDFDTALTQAGQQMEDSVVAAYCALVLGLLAKHNLDTVDIVRGGMPSKTFSEMMAVLRKFVSFMNLTGSSGTGLENVRRIIKYLEAV